MLVEAKASLTRTDYQVCSHGVAGHVMGRGHFQLVSKESNMLLKELLKSLMAWADYPVCSHGFGVQDCVMRDMYSLYPLKKELLMSLGIGRLSGMLDF